MYARMIVDDVEVVRMYDASTVESNRPTLGSLWRSVLSVGFAMVVAILGFMLGLTLMVVLLGLMPVALLWVWLMNKRAEKACTELATDDDGARR